MRHEALMAMSETELDGYARVIGIDVTGKKTVEKKVEEIEARRERIAEIDVLGVTLAVPIKRMRDKRVADIMAKRAMSDADANKLLDLVLGKEQVKKLVQQATDSDGTVDTDAIGFALVSVITSDELKNY